MIRLKDHPPPADSNRLFGAEEGGAGTLLDAADLLSLAGDDQASGELRALGRRLTAVENALLDDPVPGEGPLACATLSREDTAAALRLLRKLASAEKKLISGDFKLLPEHVGRWRHEFQDLGFAVDGKPSEVMLWEPYKGIYKTLAVLEEAATEGAEVESVSPYEWRVGVLAMADQSFQKLDVVPSAILSDGLVMVPLWAVTQLSLTESYHLPPIGSSGQRTAVATHDDTISMAGVLAGSLRFTWKFLLETMAEASKRGTALEGLTHGAASGLILVTSMTIRTDLQVESLSFSASAGKLGVIDVAITLVHMPLPGALTKILEVASLGIGALADFGVL